MGYRYKSIFFIASRNLYYTKAFSFYTKTRLSIEQMNGVDHMERLGISILNFYKKSVHFCQRLQ